MIPPTCLPNWNKLPCVSGSASSLVPPSERPPLAELSPLVDDALAQHGIVPNELESLRYHNNAIYCVVAADAQRCVLRVTFESLQHEPPAYFIADHGPQTCPTSSARPSSPPSSCSITPSTSPRAPSWPST